MTHLWIRTEHRPNERRVGITPDGVRDLIARGFRISIEESPHRILPVEDFIAAGATSVPEGSWPEAPRDAIIFGLKELPEDGTPLPHRHIMFGHAYKGQAAGPELLRRFRDGGGALLDLEYLTDATGRRLAAFGYWAGFAGAAVSLKAWAAQKRGTVCGPVDSYPTQAAMTEDLLAQIDATCQPRPRAIVIGALGRVGSGAADLLEQMGVPVTKWDMAETAGGGPFPQILTHDLFINCILARPGTPVFMGPDALNAPRNLTVIGDVACDPTSDFNPVPVYDRATDWAAPVVRVAEAPVLDVMAIDNLPSLLPLESAQDFARQLLPVLMMLDGPEQEPWQRAEALFRQHAAAI